MPVKGADKAIAALRRIPDAVRENLEDALAQAADLVLADMRRFVPRHSGDLAGALGRAVINGGLGQRIGLPTEELASDFFYARFIEEGTKGGQVTYRRSGSVEVHTMSVPMRPARPFMAPALDLNRDEIIQLIRAAIQAGVDRAT